MGNHSSRINTHRGDGRLPIELITIIVGFFVAQTEIKPLRLNTDTDPILTSWSISEICALRLVCKNWCTAATPFAFHTIYLYKPSRVNNLLHDCRNLVWDTKEFSPVKRLRIENIWYPGISHGENSDEETQVSRRERLNFEITHRFCPLSMDEVADAITVFGQNLVELDLSFSNSIGISPYLMNSLKEITSLKKLRIYADQRYERNNDSVSISALLNVTPTLQSLIIACSHLDLDVLNLKPQALPALQYLWFRKSRANIHAISHICKVIKDHVKVIEYDKGDGLSNLGKAIEPMKETLQGLICTHILTHLPKNIIGMTFPQLRVVRSVSWLELGVFPLHSWAQWPILQTVRTFVSTLNVARRHWGRTLKNARFQKPTNLKLFICTTGWHEKIVDESLARDFEAHGIKCYFSKELRPHELLELDYKLNGPMK